MFHFRKGSSPFPYYFNFPFPNIRTYVTLYFYRVFHMFYHHCYHSRSHHHWSLILICGCDMDQLPPSDVDHYVFITVQVLAHLEACDRSHGICACVVGSGPQGPKTWPTVHFHNCLNTICSRDCQVHFAELWDLHRHTPGHWVPFWCPRPWALHPILWVCLRQVSEGCLICEIFGCSLNVLLHCLETNWAKKFFFQHASLCHHLFGRTITVNAMFNLLRLMSIFNNQIYYI